MQHQEYIWRIKNKKQKKKKMIQTQKEESWLNSAGTQVFTKMYISAKQPGLKALTVRHKKWRITERTSKRRGVKTEDAWLERQKCRRAD